MTRSVRPLARAALLLAALTLTAPALVPAADAATSTGAAARAHRPVHLPLPDGFEPEGIAIGRGATAYLGSRVDGDIYRMSLTTGVGRVIAQGPGTESLGMKIDDRGRLFVAGGSGGDARVLDTPSGRLLASYDLTSATSFVNDVVLTPRVAYLTDSQQAQLYALPLGRGGALPPQSRVRTLPLTGDWEQVEGINANGITRTPNGGSLLVINSTSGLLYRVNPRTGVARTVDLGGVSLANGDGMWLEGRTLYVVLNVQNRIAVVHLDRGATRGRVTGYLRSPDFDVPTTIARSGDSFYLPNARFTTAPTTDTPYWVTRLRVD